MKPEWRLLLADLSYERRSPSPLAAPMAIAGLATYAQAQLGAHVEVRVVKTIPEFLEIIRAERFQVAGFSHYVWNANLSVAMAEQLRAAQPECVTIFGGPHLPIHQGLQETYLRNLTIADFFIEKEGETPLIALLAALEKHSFCAEAVKPLALPSVRTILQGKVISGPLAPRLRDLDVIPSPYLAGIMDEFMAAGFSPMVENNRGCPFKCAFCGEGDRYHSQVAHHSLERLIAEYEYCARFMKAIPQHPFADCFYFSDSNTGMYNQDQALCRALKELRELYGWPNRVITSTGKNSKEKILNCVELLGGALTLTASVQSTDPEVLKAVRRDNISLEVIMESAQSGDHRSYAEIILGLPGDTYKKHLKSIQDMMDAGIDELAIINLMVLPDTPMFAPEYRQQYQLDVRFRLLVKGFVCLELGGNTRTIIEHEQVCVGTAGMNFSDYQRARVAGLLVAIYYNNRFTKADFDFFAINGITPFDFLNALIELPKPPALEAVLERFRTHLAAELFNSLEELEAFMALPDTHARLLAGEIGVSLVYHYAQEALALPEALQELGRAAAFQVGGETLVTYLDATLLSQFVPSDLFSRQPN